MKDRRTQNQRHSDAVFKAPRPAKVTRSDRPKMPTLREVLFGRRR